MAAIITTHVGGGQVGRITEPVAAHDVRLKHPSGVSLAADGSILIADSNAHAIRSARADGTVVTIAGGNGQGYSGDGGPALACQMFEPTMAVTAPDGSILVADRDNDAIRIIRLDGTIDAYAGGRGLGYGGDDGLAAEAQIARPRALALDASGGLWFTDRDNHAVRLVTPDGRVVTVAGGRRGYDGDGGDARRAAMWRPRGLEFDARGHLFVADRNNHAVREIDLDGRISTFAGGNGQGYGGDGGDARAAQFDHVSGVVFDADGMAYISDHFNHAIRRVDPEGRIDTVVGGHGPGLSGDGGDARECQLNYPSGLVIDAAGNLYIADRNNDVTRVVTGLCAPGLPLPTTTPAPVLGDPSTLPPVVRPASSGSPSLKRRIGRLLGR
ncbi:MAG: hypothetical protein ACXWCM_03910 [Acidimicrobiales bacterium]